MGVSVKIGGYRFPASDYSVVEASTPLGAGDSSGQVGTIDITVPRPDPNTPLRPGAKLLDKYGPDFFVDEPVEIRDSARGFVPGTVRSVSRSDDDASFTFSCISRLDLVNVYNIEAKPYVGNLQGVFNYYLSLAGVTTGRATDSTVASRAVAYPGWAGDLWYHLKLMAAAQECEIALVNGVITLRPVRARKILRAQNISRTSSRQLGTLAQAVEVYNYNAKAITNQLVYPTGSWGDLSTEVLNVNAGEDAEYQLELSGSVSSIQTPTMQTYVAPNHRSSSVYTVVANDGLPVPPALWTANGGRVEFIINPDTVSLTVKLRGPSGIPTADGEEATHFSLALASDATDNRYSTLRIVGTGVSLEKEAIRINTGVTPQQSGTDIGETIDNPFIVDLDTAYRAGIWAAARYAGPPITISGSVVAMDVEPTLGNVGGSRIYDRRSHRWYRIRSGTTTKGDISFDAEDDLTFGDVDEAWSGYTYEQVQERFQGLTYRQVNAAGLYE